MLKKRISPRGYFLGNDKEGIPYYLELPRWDCDWYWGLGYINGNNCMFHWDSAEQLHTIDGRSVNTVDGFANFFAESPLYSAGNGPTWEKYSDVYKLADIMNSLYTARAYSDLMYRGNSHYTSKGVPSVKNEAEYKRVNTEVIPTLLRALHELLAPENTPFNISVPAL